MKTWKKITIDEDVNTIINAWKLKSQIIFKDSTTYGINAYAKERLEMGTDLITSTADFNYLDLLTYRSVSNYIAK